MKESPTEMGDREPTEVQWKARVERERKARIEAEAIAERSLRHLYVNQERLRLLQQVAAASNEDTNLDATLQTVLDAVCAHTGWPIGHVYRPDPMDPQRLAPSTIWHLVQPEAFERFRVITEETTFRLGEGLPGRVLASGQPAWISDVAADPNFSRGANDPGVRGAFAFPVLVEREVVAVLEFFSVHVEEPDDALLEAMEYVGTQLAHAVERVRVQKRLEQYAEELKERNAELEQFAYVASHDLQEPLRMVTGFLQLLQRRYADQLDETADEYIAYAVDGASRMQVLIQDLLAYSRVGTHAGSIVPVDVNDVVREVEEDLSVAIDDHDASVIVEELAIVEADPTQLRQVFQNLLSNAIKFSSRETPVVRISAERRRDGETLVWQFAVADNGIGIEPQHAERVFQIFQRLHTREEYEGTGIGLAVSKKIVERHGGRIWFESKPGRGSTFYFTLPLRPALSQSDRVNG